MESKFSRDTEGMQKLFEIYSGPSSEGEGLLDFKIIPSKELEENMRNDWIDRMGNDVAELFMEYAGRAADGEEIADDVGIIKMVAKINKDGYIFIENTAMDILQDMIEQMDESEQEAFRRLSKVFSNKVIDLIHEHLDAAISLSQK